MVITAMSTLFKHTYRLTDMQIGLTFISSGGGCIIGTLTTGKFLDVDYRRFRSHYHDTPEHFPLEHARLRTMWFWISLACASVLVFGWTLEYNVHISVPMISTFVLSWSATSIMSVVTTFIVDVFLMLGASAEAGFEFGYGCCVSSLALVLLQLRLGSRKRKGREERGRGSTKETLGESSNS
jgi:hypothetical protein